MNGQVLNLTPGSRLSLDGDVVEVAAIEGTLVTIRNDRTRQFSAMQISRLVASACPAGGTCPSGDAGESPGLMLGSLTHRQREQLAERAGHVREVLTGYKSGHPDEARPGEPRPEYRPAQPLKARYQAKAGELRVTSRTVERWAAGYRASGEAGLAGMRALGGRGTAVDPRWDEAVRVVLAEMVSDSTPTRSAVLRKAAARLEELHGAGIVPVPSAATAYRRLAELAKGTNAVSGSAKGRRSIAARPVAPYGRLRATRPGEYAVLDTQDLDVFAMEPVTCRWVRAQLTIAQDLFTRSITGLRVTAVSTRAVDVAGVLYQAVAPQPAPQDWPEDACWAYHGVPQHLVFTEDGRLPGIPVCPPEALVVDHGKAFLSAHVISVCARLGISIQPTQPKKPTDKPTCERFFRTLREGLIQHLPAYKGPDVYSRGDRVEDAAFLFLHELEDVIREWVALVYHRSRQGGLAVPEWPRLQLSPNEMYEVGVARAGLLRIPAAPELAYEFFEVHPRTIQHYGVEVGGLRYDGPALDGYRGVESPYGGRYAGRWPLRINPDDVRWAWFQDPADNSWHRLEWEHAAGLGTPFSGEAARYARQLAARSDRHPDAEQALAGLLARWDQGMVTGRRERRMAVRLAAERAALPDPAARQAARIAVFPQAADDGEKPPPAVLSAVPGFVNDDDEPGEACGDPGDDDFYADAFEVLE